MKYVFGSLRNIGLFVAPHEGAWIEIPESPPECIHPAVAPHEGAWIEILLMSSSHFALCVAPHEGAWIEIHVVCIGLGDLWRRTPRGCVD